MKNPSSKLMKNFPRVKKKRVLKEMWVCDKCRQIHFDDYNEAVRHENVCNGTANSIIITEERNMKVKKHKICSHLLASVSDRKTLDSINESFLLRRVSKIPKSIVTGTESKGMRDQQVCFGTSTEYNDRQNKHTIKKRRKEQNNIPKLLWRSDMRQNCKINKKYDPGSHEGREPKRVRTITKRRYKFDPLILSQKSNCGLKSERPSNNIPNRQLNITSPLTLLKFLKKIKTSPQKISNNNIGLFCEKYEAKSVFPTNKKTLDNINFSGNSGWNKMKLIKIVTKNGGVNSSCSMISLKQSSTIKHSYSSSFSFIPSNHNSIILYSAPKFPVPNHVLGENKNELFRSNYISLSHKQYTTFICTAKYQPGICSNSCSYSVDYKGSLIDNFQSQDDLRVRENPNLLYNLFASIFKPKMFTVNQENLGNMMSSYLLTEKYAFQNITNDMHFKENQETALKLLKFINEWREHRQKIIQSGSQKARNVINESFHGNNCKLKRTKYIDDDFWDLNSDEDSNSLCNVFLLTGPTGSGKTSLVHSMARSCHCVTLEINTTMERGGQALKLAIEECTQSHSNLALLRKANDAEVSGQFIHNEEHEDGLSLALVLIDEVDLLFENSGDAGFWPAFGNLTKKAKCPIILTATGIPQGLYESSIRFQQFSMRKPTPNECASKLHQIAINEGISMHMGKNIQKRLENIAKICNCDMRKIMNEMQLFWDTTINIENKQKLFVSKYLDEEATGTYHNVVSAIQYPFIKIISPKIVPSDEHSVITIKGNNFVGDGWHVNYCKIFVYVGEQISPAVRVIDCNTIIAICPPCLIPYDVDFNGNYMSKFTPCITCRYAEVIVKVLLTNGMEIGSNSSPCRIGSTGDLNTVPYVSYNFVNDDYILAQTSKEKMRHIGQHKETKKSKISPIVTDVILPNCSLQNDFLSTILKEREIPYSEGYITYLGPVVDPLFFHSSSLGLMLEGAMFECIFLNDCHEHPPLNLIKITGQHQSNHEYPIGEKDSLCDLMRRAELSSDATLLEDSLTSLCIPLLSGAIPGYGTDMIDDPNLLRNNNGKPPSIEKVYSSGWNESLFFFGSSDTYVTRPYLQRDRDLFSNSLNKSRGQANYKSDLLVSPVYTDCFKDKEDEKIFLSNDSIMNPGEDLFVPSAQSISMLSLPSILRGVANSLCTESHTSFNDDIISLVIHNFLNKTSSLIPLVMPLIGDEKLTNSIENGILDHQLAMDYCPILRKIAYIESKWEIDFKMKKTSSGKNHRYASNCSRRTRQSLKGRVHYFETLMCLARCMNAERKAYVKHIGELLAKSMLK